MNVKVNVLLLKIILTTRKITQRQLSKKVGVSEEYISMIMHKEYEPSQKLFNKILKIIGIKKGSPIYCELIYNVSRPALHGRRVV